MKPELVSEERVRELYDALVQNDKTLTGMDWQMFLAGARAALEELGVVRVVEAADKVVVDDRRFSMVLWLGEAVLVRPRKS